MTIFSNQLGKIEYCIEPENEIYIDMIETHIKQKGHGRILLQEFLSHFPNCKITLIASSCHGTPQRKLERFYRKFGFVECRRNSFGCTMELER